MFRPHGRVKPFRGRKLCAVVAQRLKVCTITSLPGFSIATLLALCAVCGVLKPNGAEAFSLPSIPVRRLVNPGRSGQKCAGTRSLGMLLDKIQLLQTANIILASGSPRRKEILNDLLKLGSKVVPSTYEEDLDKSLFTPEAYVQENARLKALEVWSRVLAAGDKPNLVIGSDTVVALDNEILEKPKSKEDAVRMLSKLSGRSHMVYSGVALLYLQKGSSEPGSFCFWEGTEVTFAALNPSVIQAYVESGDPMDKAGSYGIQSLGGTLVSGIKGCFYNVMGFPMHRFCVHLSKIIEDGHVVPPS